MFRKRCTLPCLALAAITALTAACDDDAPTEPPANVIGPTGGTFVFADGVVSLVVPPGAVSQNITVSADPASGYPESWTVVDGTVFSFVPEGTEFELPVELIIKYDPGQWPSRVEAADLAIYEANEEYWQPIGDSEVNEADTTVSTLIDGFSVLGVLGVPAGITGRIATPGQLMKVGQSITFRAVVGDTADTWTPGSVAWSTSGSDVISIEEAKADSCVVTALAPGETDLVAIVDAVFVEQLVDFVAVESAQPGDIEPGSERWRAEFPHLGPANGGPALDGNGRIFVIDSTYWVVAFDRNGRTVIHEYSWCQTLRMPAVTQDGHAYVVGWWMAGDREPQRCTERRSADGSLEWSAPAGEGDVAPAVGPDGSVAVQWSYPFVYMSLISSDGTELWRDTLLQVRVTQKNSPSIAANGDIYAQVRGPGDPEATLWRIASDGTIRWTKPIGLQRGAAPALVGETIIVSVRNGLEAYDTAGTLLWQADVLGTQSSPIVDQNGDIYVASSSGLHSYDLAGNQRWVADTVRSTGSPFWADPPTLLTDGSLLVYCAILDADSRPTGLSELCAVRTSDGEVTWRTELGGLVWGSPAVSPDGTIYVYYSLSPDGRPAYLLALWGDSPPLTEGWPTEGGGMGRLRRQLP